MIIKVMIGLIQQFEQVSTEMGAHSLLTWDINSELESRDHRRALIANGYIQLKRGYSFVYMNNSNALQKW